MGNKLFNILDEVTPFEPISESNSKTIIILVISLIIVLVVAFVAAKCIKKNSAPKEVKKTSKKK